MSSGENHRNKSLLAEPGSAVSPCFIEPAAALPHVVPQRVTRSVWSASGLPALSGARGDLGRKQSGGQPPHSTRFARSGRDTVAPRQLFPAQPLIAQRVECVRLAGAFRRAG